MQEKNSIAPQMAWGFNLTLSTANLITELQ